MKPLPPVFGQMLDRFKPDIVHFQHLVYLSTTCVREAVRRQIPVVMTLHDYWLICQRGRFLKPDLSVCPGQTDTGCARCFHHVLDPKMSVLYRWLKPLLGQQSWLRERARRWYGKRAGSRPVSLAAQRQIQARMTHIRTLCASVSLFLAPSRFLREQFVAFGIPQGENSVSRVWLADRGYSARSETLCSSEKQGRAVPRFWLYRRC